VCGNFLKLPKILITGNIMLDNNNFAALSISLGFLFSYHAFLYITLSRSFGNHIQLSINLNNAVNWLRKHKERGDAASVTLAVQTLRNTILVVVFLGGYSLQMGFTVLSSVATISADQIHLKIRAVIISSCLFLSFLCWVSVVRIASNLGYFIGTLDYSPTGTDDIEKVTKSDSDSFLSMKSTDPLTESQRMMTIMLTSFK
jgi:hypothetical protein